MGIHQDRKTEYGVLKGAPISFAGLVVLSVSAGIAIGAWHYGERLETQQEQIQRYRLALGIDKGGPNALAELNNAELRAKALNSVAEVRGLCFSFQKREEQIRPCARWRPLLSHALFPTYFGILLWLGLYLRDARLRALVPLRS